MSGFDPGFNPRFNRRRQFWVRVGIVILAVLTAAAFIGQGIVWWREYRIPN